MSVVVVQPSIASRVRSVVEFENVYCGIVLEMERGYSETNLYVLHANERTGAVSLVAADAPHTTNQVRSSIRSVSLLWNEYGAHDVFASLQIGFDEARARSLIENRALIAPLGVIALPTVERCYVYLTTTPVRPVSTIHTVRAMGLPTRPVFLRCVLGRASSRGHASSRGSALSCFATTALVSVDVRRIAVLIVPRVRTEFAFASVRTFTSSVPHRVVVLVSARLEWRIRAFSYENRRGCSVACPRTVFIATLVSRVRAGSFPRERVVTKALDQSHRDPLRVVRTRSFSIARARGVVTAWPVPSLDPGGYVLHTTDVSSGAISRYSDGERTAFLYRSDLTHATVFRKYDVTSAYFYLSGTDGLYYPDSSLFRTTELPRMVRDDERELRPHLAEDRFNNVPLTFVANDDNQYYVYIDPLGVLRYTGLRAKAARFKFVKVGIEPDLYYVRENGTGKYMSKRSNHNLLLTATEDDYAEIVVTNTTSTTQYGVNMYLKTDTKFYQKTYNLFDIQYSTQRGAETRLRNLDEISWAADSPESSTDSYVYIDFGAVKQYPNLIGIDFTKNTLCSEDVYSTEVTVFLTADRELYAEHQWTVLASGVDISSIRSTDVEVSLDQSWNRWLIIKTTRFFGRAAFTAQLEIQNMKPIVYSNTVAMEDQAVYVYNDSFSQIIEENPRKTKGEFLSLYKYEVVSPDRSTTTVLQPTRYVLGGGYNTVPLVHSVRMHTRLLSVGLSGIKALDRVMYNTHPIAFTCASFDLDSLRSLKLRELSYSDYVGRLLYTVQVVWMEYNTTFVGCLSFASERTWIEAFDGVMCNTHPVSLSCVASEPLVLGVMAWPVPSLTPEGYVLHTTDVTLGAISRYSDGERTAFLYRSDLTHATVFRKYDVTSAYFYLSGTDGLYYPDSSLFRTTELPRMVRDDERELRPHLAEDRFNNVPLTFVANDDNQYYVYIDPLGVLRYTGLRAKAARFKFVKVGIEPDLYYVRENGTGKYMSKRSNHNLLLTATEDDYAEIVVTNTTSTTQYGVNMYLKTDTKFYQKTYNLFDIQYSTQRGAETRLRNLDEISWAADSPESSTDSYVYIDFGAVKQYPNLIGIDFTKNTLCSEDVYSTEVTVFLTADRELYAEHQWTVLASGVDISSIRSTDVEVSLDQSWNRWLIIKTTRFFGRAAFTAQLEIQNMKPIVYSNTVAMEDQAVYVYNDSFSQIIEENPRKTKGEFLSLYEYEVLPPDPSSSTVLQPTRYVLGSGYDTVPLVHSVRINGRFSSALKTQMYDSRGRAAFQIRILHRYLFRKAQRALLVKTIPKVDALTSYIVHSGELLLDGVQYVTDHPFAAYMFDSQFLLSGGVGTFNMFERADLPRLKNASNQHQQLERSNRVEPTDKLPRASRFVLYRPSRGANYYLTVGSHPDDVSGVVTYALKFTTRYADACVFKTVREGDGAEEDVYLKVVACEYVNARGLCLSGHEAHLTDRNERGGTAGAGVFARVTLSKNGRLRVSEDGAPPSVYEGVASLLEASSFAASYTQTNYRRDHGASYSHTWAAAIDLSDYTSPYFVLQLTTNDYPIRGLCGINIRGNDIQYLEGDLWYCTTIEVHLSSDLENWTRALVAERVETLPAEGITVYKRLMFESGPYSARYVKVVARAFRHGFPAALSMQLLHYPEKVLAYNTTNPLDMGIKSNAFMATDPHYLPAKMRVHIEHGYEFYNITAQSRPSILQSSTDKVMIQHARARAHAPTKILKYATVMPSVSTVRFVRSHQTTGRFRIRKVFTASRNAQFVMEARRTMHLYMDASHPTTRLGEGGGCI